MCRREGIKLFLKGSRCDSPKCAIERRDQAPGMHTRRGKPSEYAIRLREKQKLKRFYGVLERQFRRYFELASRARRFMEAEFNIHRNTAQRRALFQAAVAAQRGRDADASRDRADGPPALVREDA